jgi:hypothetical protein
MAYADENYKAFKDVYEVVAQVFQELKNDRHGAPGWNKALAELDGVTMRFLGEDRLELTYHCYEIATPESLALKMRDTPPAKCLDELQKELKKRFKKAAKKALKLKKLKEYEAVEKVSKIQAERSWAFGDVTRVTSSVGKFLVRAGRVYEFSAALSED